MSVTYDTTASTSGTFTDTLSWSHTVSTAGNPALFVGVGDRYSGAPPDINSLTYNSVSLGTAKWNFVGTVGDIRNAGYGMAGPDTGSAYTVALTFASAPADLDAVSVSATGVDQTTPFGTSNTASGNSGGPATVDISAATDDLVVDNYCGWPEPTVGSGQSQRAKAQISTNNWYSTSTEAGATTVTMSWSLAYSDSWTIGGLAFKNLSAVAPKTLLLMGVG